LLYIDGKSIVADCIKRQPPRDFAEFATNTMESEGYKKLGSVGSIFFALITGEIAGAIKEGLVSFREVREPCWKKVSEMKCSPGGVVYDFEKALH